MFNYLSTEYISLFSYLNLFNYITFRTGAAILTSLFFSLIFGELIITKLKKIQPIGQPIREDGPENHIIEKSGKPHKHKVQATMAMEQRSRFAAKNAKDPETKKRLSQANRIYKAYLEKLKKRTKE